MIAIQRQSKSKSIPNNADIKKWVTLTLKQKSNRKSFETTLSRLFRMKGSGSDQNAITLRIIDEPDMQALNKQFRHKNKSTNVLSFPLEDENYLGDIALCAPVIVQEAREQYKKTKAHWAHMVIHGVLHLQGYDHLKENDAKKMEALEIRLLSQLGFDNPYEEDTYEK